MTATLVATPDPEPHEHTWRWIERYGLWYCMTCRATEEDQPDDAA